MSLFKLGPPPGHGAGAGCHGAAASKGHLRGPRAERRRAAASSFRGITPISVVSFQLPRAKVWGILSQPCAEMTYLVRCP